MAFSLSGNVAAGAQAALDQVLERRMREQMRQQQEQEAAARLAMEQQRIQLATTEAAARAKERADDVAFRNEGRNIDIADRVSANTPIGQTTPETAAVLRKSPIHAPLVEGRQIIDARPIPGTAPLDTSGPQQYDAYLGTEPQRQKAKQVVDLRRITEGLKGAPNEAARKALGFEAIGAGVGGEIPQGMLGPTETEKTAQQLAAEKREEDRWLRQNRITSGQADARQAAQIAAQERVQQRGIDKEKPDPATQRAQRDATLEQAKKLRDSVGIGDLTGQRVGNKAYWYGLRDTPAPGSEAASAKAHFDSLISLLALPRLGYLKGPMSDKDIEFIKSAASDLKTDMTDKDFVDTLNNIIFRLENPEVGFGDGASIQRPSVGHGGGGLTPASSHGRGVGPSTLDKINALRQRR